MGFVFSGRSGAVFREAVTSSSMKYQPSLLCRQGPLMVRTQSPQGVIILNP